MPHCPSWKQKNSSNKNIKRETKYSKQKKTKALKFLGLKKYNKSIYNNENVYDGVIKAKFGEESSELLKKLKHVFGIGE